MASVAIRILLILGLGLGTLGRGGRACAAERTPNPPPVGAPAAPGQPLRLAIGRFATSTDSQLLRDQNERLLDYLTVELSQRAGFELLERSEIDRVIKEAALSLSFVRQGSNAVKIGHLLHADWLLGGSVLSPAGTNYVVARIIDARTGVVRDFASLPFPTNDLHLAARAIAEFTATARTRPVALGQRVFLALGGFEDLGVNHRYPDFRKELRVAFERTLAGRPVALVERTLIHPLWEELRLSLGGLTQGGVQTAGSQPAFMIVDGIFQAVEDGKSQIDLILRIETIGVEKRSFTLKASAGRELNEKILEQVELVLSGGNRNSNLTSNSRRAEAQAQLERGKDRARLPQALVVNYPLGGYFAHDDDAKRRQNITEAMEAFEAALLLDPQSSEAKLFLGRCLLEPGFAKKDVARDYLQEVVAAEPNSTNAASARRLFIESYLYENDQHAIELYLADVRKTTQALERAKLLFTVLAPCERLHNQGLLPTGEAIRHLTNYVWAEWDAVEWARTNQASQGAILGAHPGLGGLTTLMNGFNSFERTLNFDRRAGQRLLDDLLPAVAARHPDFATHLWSTYVVWLSYGDDAVSPAAIEQLKRALGVCIARPETIPDRPYLQRYALPEIRTWAETNRQPEISAMLDRLMPRPVVQTNVITLSRPTGPAPEPFRLGPPVFSATGFILFAFDGDRIWLKDDFLPAVYDRTTKTLQHFDWPDEIRHVITCIQPGREQVWFGSDGSGLVEVDKKTLRARRYTEADGLLLPNITALHLATDKLWIGFGREKSGGLGYLDLRTHQIVAFTRALKPEYAKDPLPALSDQDGTAPPRNRVVGVAATAPDQFWVASEWKGVQRFWPATKEWRRHPTFVQEDNISCLVADTNYVVYGSMGYDAALVIHSLAKKQPVPFHGFSPYLKGKLGSLQLANNMVASLLLKGNKLWVGGYGYLGRVDLATGRVEALCELDEQEVRVRCMEIDGTDLWVAVEKNLYRVPVPAAKNLAANDQ